MGVPTHNAAVEIDDCNAGENENAEEIDDPRLSPSQAHDASARSHTPNKEGAHPSMEGAHPSMEGSPAGMDIGGPAVPQPVNPGTLM